jgi:hypothetical protein
MKREVQEKMSNKMMGTGTAQYFKYEFTLFRRAADAYS